MIYDIKSIPTEYAKVLFRSRLEARWAVYFDLTGIKWVYEPFDLDGWTPDFMLKKGGYPVLAEVKPLDLSAHGIIQVGDPVHTAYSKVFAHRKYWVYLLGISPLETPAGGFDPGLLLDRPPSAKMEWDDVNDAFNNALGDKFWNGAGNVVRYERA